MKTKRTNDERVSFLTQLISESKSGYENYKPHFKELQDAYLLENKVMQKLRKSVGGKIKCNHRKIK